MSHKPSPLPTEDERKARILSALADGEWRKTADLTKACSIEAYDVIVLATELNRDELIEVGTTGNKGDRAMLYRLARTGITPFVPLFHG